jgi:hypothetical protein
MVIIYKMHIFFIITNTVHGAVDTHSAYCQDNERLQQQGGDQLPTTFHGILRSGSFVWLVSD